MSHGCEQKNNIEKILDRLTTLEISKGNLEFLIEQFIESNKDVVDTMRSIQVAMTDIHNSLGNNEKEIKNINKKIDKIYENEDKNKIDIRDVIKSNLIKGGIGLAGLYGVYELILKDLWNK